MPGIEHANSWLVIRRADPYNNEAVNNNNNYYYYNYNYNYNNNLLNKGFMKAFFIAVNINIYQVLGVNMQYTEGQ